MNAELFAERLAELEKGVWLLAAMVLATTILISLAIWARRTRREFIVKDRKGSPRLVLRMNEEDEPEIQVWGRDGRSWAVFGCDSSGVPVFTCTDREGRGRIGLRIPESGPFFFTCGPEGKTELQVGLLSDGVPGVILRDRSGRHQFGFSLDGSGGPHIVLHTESVRRLAIGVSPVDEPALVMFDREGRERFGIGMDETGAPYLQMLDEHGNVVNSVPAGGGDATGP